MTKEFDIAIVGGGIIGIAIAEELVKHGYTVAILEKNLKIASETTEGNSGVIHGGFDASPEKLNARLNVAGRKLYQEKWFKEFDFAWKKSDSLVLAFSEDEERELKELYNRGIKNGLTTDEMKIINHDEILALEPNINSQVKSALICTASYLIDPVELTHCLWNKAKENGAQLFLNHEVTGINENNKGFEIINKCGKEKITFNVKRIINAAGHYSDVIAKMVNAQTFTLMARRGQYLILEKTEATSLNNHIIFLAPTKYGKGVVIATTTDGHVMVGPTAEENIKKEETRLITVEMMGLIQQIGNKIMPNLNMKKICKVTSGSRPIAIETNDFIIEYAKNNKNFINVAGIKSPGLTSAPAIALMVTEMVKNAKI